MWYSRYGPFLETNRRIIIKNLEDNGPVLQTTIECLGSREKIKNTKS